MISNTRLFDSLKELGVIERMILEDIYREAEENHEEMAEMLLQRDLISDNNLGLLIADLYKVPYVKLQEKTINRDIVSKVTEEMARARRLVLYEENETEASLAMNDPEDYEAIALIKKRLSKEVKVFFATYRDISMAFFSYRKEVGAVFEEMIARSIGEAQKVEDEAPVIQLVEAMLTYAYQSRASDIHIDPSEDEIAVRFRVDGVLHDVVKLPVELKDRIVMRILVMTNLPIDEHASALDGKFDYMIPQLERIDVRVSIVPVTHGQKIVMRLLAGNVQQYALMDLGLSERDIARVREAYKKPWGMILSTGPTGSGKTTTLYSFVKILNRRNVNIMTIEDPVEYEVRGINQIQVNNKTNLTFAAGLRSIVRQDPNIILVGEIRDEETAGIAVNAALTGHLVLSTIHTNDAATTFPRLLDMKIEPFLVASSVNMVVAQRLVRKICMSCRESVVMEEDILKKMLPEETLKKYLKKETAGWTTYKGKGCQVCGNSGYVGRVGIFEVMEMTDEIRDAITTQKDAEEIAKIAISQGMTTMLDDGLDKVRMGITTIDELLRVVKE